MAGTYRSVGPLGAFEGQDASGKWTLSIVDTAGGDIGTLQQWSLKIRY